MTHPYRTLVFDCINTVLLPNPQRLPRLVVDGKEVTSTAPLLMERVAAHLPGLPTEEVHRAMRRAWRRSTISPVPVNWTRVCMPC